MRGVSCEDWNTLEKCRLPVEQIIFEGDILPIQYDYFVTLDRKLDEFNYTGTMLGRKLAAPKGAGKHERDVESRFVQTRFGKTMATVTTQGNELLLSLRLYSYAEDDWIAPFYDAEQHCLLHCDAPILSQPHAPGSKRFLMLDEYDTVMKINTDRISRICSAPQKG